MTLASQPSSALPSADQAAAALVAARQRTLSLIDGLGETDLERVHSPLMSPLVWDLAHIAAYEDLWLAHRSGGLDLLRPDLAAAYDAFETPRAVRGEVELLDTGRALAYMEAVRERTLSLLASQGAADGRIAEMVIQHELQHDETMLQTLCLARLDSHRPQVTAAPPGPGGHTGLETVEVAAGEFQMGAPAGRFAYDNERPRHPRSLPAFRIGRTPVTNATWRTFAEGGGYERREWWSDEGWAWKEEYDIERPGGWVTDHGEIHEWRLAGAEPLDPDKPVIHVSWFEADAFARAHGVRLPTEAEWEKAATWSQGDSPDLAAGSGSTDANLIEQGLFGTAAVGAHPAGAAPCGALGMLGDVWEWTSSEFHGYRGFAAWPYREYSEVFFGNGYRVLRGGSWASSARVATPTFRNWDLPQRRQIFAGVRIARDA